MGRCINLFSFCLTLASGLAVGYLFYRLKVPGGMMVGGILGAAALNMTLGVTCMPNAAKTLAQLTAGAFIGSGVQKSDLRRLRSLWRLLLVLLTGYLAMNLLVSFAIYLISPLDLATALFCAVPGGISDIPLIAADMGADTGKVAVLQFVRMLFGVGVVPTLIGIICKDEAPLACEATQDPAARPEAETGGTRDFIITISLALACGALGAVSAIPAAPLLFSLVGVIALKLTYGKAHLPMWTKRLAQVLSGTYIGQSFGVKQFFELKYLLLPVLLILVGYFSFCFIMGILLNRMFSISRKEAMLASIPAGASDVALISMDIGIPGANLVILQLIRLIVVVGIFPHLFGLIIWLHG